MNMPLLGMGTWGMGGKYERDESNAQESVAALKYGIKLGIRLIDTAELYGQGLTEEIVAEALKGFSREEVLIVSKVWKTNLHYDDIFRSVEGSLRRLKTDYIDLYLIHWPNSDIPLEETMKAMKELKNKGLIRHIGVSNFTVELMEIAMGFLGEEKLAANQIEYSLIERGAEKSIIPFCVKNNIRVMAYRPLARGALASSANATLEALALKYKKTPVQIMLNWIISRDITAIPMAIKKEHLKENFGALGWKMSPDDIALLGLTTQ